MSGARLAVVSWEECTDMNVQRAKIFPEATSRPARAAAEAVHTSERFPET